MNSSKNDIFRCDVNVKKIVENYIHKKIWLAKENSNQRFSYSSVSWRIAGEIMERYVLSEVYPKEKAFTFFIALAHIDGDFHIHA